MSSIQWKSIRGGVPFTSPMTWRPSIIISSYDGSVLVIRGDSRCGALPSSEWVSCRPYVDVKGDRGELVVALPVTEVVGCDKLV